MKRKILQTVLIAGIMATALPVEASSFGRSGGGGFSSSRSSSVSSSRSYSSPSISRSSSTSSSKGFGGYTGSMGVRKSAVTAPVAAKVNSGKAPSYYRTTTPTTSAAPIHAAAPVTTHSSPVTSHVGSGAGSSFVSGMAGGVVGSLIGNALFSGHGNNGGGTTIVNNGGTAAGTPVAVDGNNVPVAAAGAAVVPVAQQSSYGFFNFLGDILSFFFTIAVLVGIGYVLYRLYNRFKPNLKVNMPVTTNKSDELPFSPTAKFWEVQRAFAAADQKLLGSLLGPDLIDEATQHLEPVDLTLHNVSHEVVLNKPNELSVHYNFTDEGEDVNQVWHYEYHDGWKLNGVENV